MSDIIQILPDNIANQIAAGEVVQRPASAVKEMLENAIDAGSTHIQLIIKDAGRTLIQVIDNGCGMSPTDARLCFERHATSKIRQAQDLFLIRTMGFRGEALASIAAVAQVELKTKMKDNELGTSIVIEGSEIKEQSVCQCSNGTSIAVKNLFFNIPARRSFLKSNSIELKHIEEEFFRVALIHTDIAFSFYSNDKLIYQLESSNLHQRITGLFGNNYK
jgi:DNA mismatch repair protein MutL